MKEEENASDSYSKSRILDARHTLKCDIYEFNGLRNRLYRYTTFQQWCGFSLSIGNSTGNATEPWILVRTGKRTVSTKQPQAVTSERLDSWASRLWRGTDIELFLRSLDCFTVRPIFSTRPITRIKRFFFFFFFFGGGGEGVVLSSNAFNIWCCILISRPPRVIRRFKRRSCHYPLFEYCCL